MDFVQYVFKKGVLRHELGEGQSATETCNLVKEALAVLTQHNAAIKSPEDLKPSMFAPNAIWFIVLKTVFERVRQV